MRRFVLMLAVVAFGCGSTDEDHEVAVPAGTAATEISPDFAINGDPATLADLRGKVVLLDFWAVWCGPCRAVFPELKRLHKTYNDKGLEVVGLTLYYGRYKFEGGKLSKSKEKVEKQDEQKMLASFVRHHELPYRIQTVTPDDFKSYKITGIPTAVLLDRKGTVRMVKVGAGAAALKALEAKIKELLAE